MTASTKNPGITSGKIRLDKWLWFARFFKTRTLASKICQAHRIRVNGEILAKSSAQVRVDDILTFPMGSDIKVIKVIALGARRGPAPEAQQLYEDLTPPKPTKSEETAKTVSAPSREKGMGRPTKKDRRAIDKLQGGD